jgi:serine/threonine protein kinase
MSAPTLGELAIKQRFIDGRTLDEALRFQRQNYMEGDFRRLGEILVDHGHCTRASVRQLLAQQGIHIVECELCSTRYNALDFQGQGACLRCGRRMRPSHESAPLTVEDAMSGGGPRADRLLAEQRQRNPRLGRYEILGEVGRGSMGVIYKGWQADLQRFAALKFLLPDPSQGKLSDEDIARFRLEAQAIARLRHPNIVTAHAIEEANGLIYMAMDFVQGVNLERLAMRGALNRDQVVTSAAQIANALHYAHEAHLLHRDVKPQNIVVDRQGKPYLVDFGIAKDRSEQQSLTTEGEILGSLAYMAPEYVQQGKAALDAQCDVYGMGVVLYECLSNGQLPYGEVGDDRLILKIVQEPPTPITEVAPTVPPDLAAICMKAIAKTKDERYQTAKELAEDLEAVSRGERPPSSSNWPVTPATPAKPAAPSSPTGSAASERPEAGGGAHTSGPTRGLLIGGGVTVVMLGLLATIFAVLWVSAKHDADAANKRTEEWRGRAMDSLLQSGQAHEAAGQLLEAEDAYTKAATWFPDDPDPLEARANLRARRGDSAGAESDRTEAQARRDAETGEE